jgi:hypothetical protein
MPIGLEDKAAARIFCRAAWMMMPLRSCNWARLVLAFLCRRAARAHGTNGGRVGLPSLLGGTGR